MQRFKGVGSGKQSFREHCATKWLLEANPRNISASKISRYIRQCNSTHAQIEMSALGTVECRIDDITGNVITVYLAEHCIIIRGVSNIMSFFSVSKLYKYS